MQSNTRRTEGKQPRFGEPYRVPLPVDERESVAVAFGLGPNDPLEKWVIDGEGRLSGCSLALFGIPSSHPSAKFGEVWRGFNRIMGPGRRVCLLRGLLAVRGPEYAYVEHADDDTAVLRHRDGQQQIIPRGMIPGEIASGPGQTTALRVGERVIATTTVDYGPFGERFEDIYSGATGQLTEFLKLGHLPGRTHGAKSSGKYPTVEAWDAGIQRLYQRAERSGWNDLHLYKDGAIARKLGIDKRTADSRMAEYTTSPYTSYDAIRKGWLAFRRSRG